MYNTKTNWKLYKSVSKRIIIQVMAVATLERCYNNPAVFAGVVKIRKGEAVKMMMEATTMDSVKAIFSHFTTHVSAQSQLPLDTVWSYLSQRF